MLDLIDIGANLTHDSFDADRDAVLARASAAGVARIVVTGTSVTSSVQAVALCEAHPRRLFATAGVHPHHAAGFDAHTATALESLLANPKVVAVGECGLDFFRDYSPRAAQREAFGAQLELAADVGKPVFLHQRDSHDEFVAMLERRRARLSGGVAHCLCLALGANHHSFPWGADRSVRRVRESIAPARRVPARASMRCATIIRFSAGGHRF